MIAPHRRAPLAALAALAAASLTTSLIACGGKVVVDAGGAGGGGTTSTSGPATTGVTSSTGGSTCDVLQSELQSKLAAAQACIPSVSSIQCSGKTIVNDACGCPIVANDKNPGAAQIAIAAFNTWVNAGCGPIECFTCPPPPDAGWFCSPDTSACAAPPFN